MEQHEEKYAPKPSGSVTSAVSWPASEQPEPVEAPPLPKIPKKGVYVLEAGDTPGNVSLKLFGRGHRAVDLVRANMNVVWDVGSEITIP